MWFVQARCGGRVICFSALQRAENSSILIIISVASLVVVSVLFSEPKIPQFNTLVMPLILIPTEFQCSSASRKFLNSRSRSNRRRTPRVSVLFSEPKIPQLLPASKDDALRLCFSALQRAENSSICSRPNRRAVETRFQCSSASRKFLNCTRSGRRGTVCR